MKYRVATYDAREYRVVHDKPSVETITDAVARNRDTAQRIADAFNAQEPANET